MDSRHVTKRPDGSWQVIAPNAERASYIADTQKEAIDRAKEICTNIGGEMFIHGVDGKIRERNTYNANDAFPPRG
ncbi:MAG: DUF2188 domain-containing protein [Clostridia bacterium]